LGELSLKLDTNVNNINAELKKKCTFEALEELKNAINSEMDELKAKLEYKLDLKADKDWVAKMLKKLQEMFESIHESR